MLDFLLLLLVPTAIAVIVLVCFKKKITFVEFAAQIGVVGVVIGMGLAIAYWQGTTDTEIWNGQVTEKEHHHVSCSHSYSCHCRTVYSGSGKNRTSHEECDTCYYHSYDVEWDVHASTGEAVSIDRVDWQGLAMPPRWGAAFVGEPFASKHSFENYIRANPQSVLLGSKGDTKRWASLVPKYPDGIYNYYYNDPVINMGVPRFDINTWNYLIREVNKAEGPRKQVHVILIVVPTNDRTYSLALKDAWLGGKKNDVDVVIGSQDGETIGFVDVMSWSTNKALSVDLRNHIQGIGRLSLRDSIAGTITSDIDHEFVRMHMKDMKWLMASFQPSGTTLIILFLLAILIEGGLAYWCVTNDITEDSPRGGDFPGYW